MVLVFRSREKRRCSLSERRLSLYGRFGAAAVADGRLSVEEKESGFVRILMGLCREGRWITAVTCFGCRGRGAGFDGLFEASAQNWGHSDA